jgi:hypothetical protein
VFSTQVASVATHHQPPDAADRPVRRPPPGTESYLIDLRDGRLLQTVSSQPQRHFYGHAVIHKGGEWLYATENDTTDPGRGVLGVYRFEGERLVHTGEISTHGIGPHEVAWLPDGETLVVANGGIRTEAESRVEMNLDAMEPSLVLMQRDGTLLSKETLAQQMNSVRHLAVGDDGTIAPASSSWALGGDCRAAGDQTPGRAVRGLPGARAAAAVDGPVHRQRRHAQRPAPGGADRATGQPLVHLGPGQRRGAPRCADARLRRGGCGAGWFRRHLRAGRCRYYDCRKAELIGQPMNLPSAFWDNHLHLA